mgnify:CR=1 FL=1
MSPVAVVPGEVKDQILPESRETERDQDQPPGALGLEGPDAPLDYREASILADGSKSVLNTPPTAPAVESLGGELNALVGDQVPGLLAHPPENPLQKSPNLLRGRLSAVNRKSHHPPREMIDGKRDPPAEGPCLWLGEGNPGNPETEGGGHGR